MANELDTTDQEHDGVPCFASSPKPLSSAFGCSPGVPLSLHVGWPNLRDREPGVREVRELTRKLTQLAARAAFVLGDAGEEEGGLVVVEQVVYGGTVRSWLPGAEVDALDPAFERAEGALEERRWEAAVAHMRHLETLLRLASNWGHAEVTYNDSGETIILDDHLGRHVVGDVWVPMLGEAS